jgi:hypothetical protein
MSLPLAIAIIVILDVLLLAFLAWMMSHPRHLTPHVSRAERAHADRRFTHIATDAPQARTLVAAEAD